MAAVATENNNDLIGNTDGWTWAERFMDLFGPRKDEIDFDLMLGWFCNAIQSGWDQGYERARQRSIGAVGYISGQLADESGAWDGKAPDWFPEPPVWLEMFEEGFALSD